MATGVLPFRGDTSGMIFDAILNRPAVPPVRLNPDLPAELERILLRSLERDRELRYQHASDLRAELQRLKRDVDSSHSLATASSSASTSAPDLLSAVIPVSGASVKAHTSGHTAAVADTSGKSVKRRWMGAAAAVVVVIGGISTYFYTHRAHGLSDKDSILVADFVNTTSEPVFDGTLKQALAVQLQQSPFLSILPEERVRETLQFMGRPPDEHVTGAVARELCQRANVNAAINGSIASLGSQYVISLEAVNCNTGESLAREQSTAESKEKVLSALGSASSQLRNKLGESLASIQKFDKPVEEATTSSLEALKAYTQGQQETNTGMNSKRCRSFSELLSWIQILRVRTPTSPAFMPTRGRRQAASSLKRKPMPCAIVSVRAKSWKLRQPITGSSPGILTKNPPRRNCIDRPTPGGQSS